MQTNGGTSQIFTPTRESDQTAKHDFFLHNGYFAGFGWFLYLWLGYDTKGKYAHHFNPAYFGTHARLVVTSLVAMLAWTTLLFKYAQSFGWIRLTVVYGAPVSVGRGGHSVHLRRPLTLALSTVVCFCHLVGGDHFSAPQR